jgi:hypothetical protein
MTPVNQNRLSEVEVWSAIRYLDPDIETIVDRILDNQTRTKKMRIRLLTAGLIVVAVAAFIAAALFFHVVAKIIH